MLSVVGEELGQRADWLSARVNADRVAPSLEGLPWHSATTHSRGSAIPRRGHQDDSGLDALWFPTLHSWQQFARARVSERLECRSLADPDSYFGDLEGPGSSRPVREVTRPR